MSALFVSKVSKICLHWSGKTPHFYIIARVSLSGSLMRLLWRELSSWVKSKLEGSCYGDLVNANAQSQLTDNVALQLLGKARKNTRTKSSTLLNFSTQKHIGKSHKDVYTRKQKGVGWIFIWVKAFVVTSIGWTHWAFSVYKFCRVGQNPK